MNWDGPILDNHLHLRATGGKGLDAVEEFVAAGGTHLLLLNRPSWSQSQPVRDAADFRVGFEETINLVRSATEILPGRAWAVLGVHPGLVSHLVDDQGESLKSTEGIMRSGIDEAVAAVTRGDALALKTGRPHYPVSAEIWDLSNRVMRYTFSRAADIDCAVQLHTEDSAELTAITEIATSVGLDPTTVVKHYASGPVDGPIPSVIAKKEALERIDPGEPFLMETDFLDDPDRPGAVLGPKTVPRRVTWLADRGNNVAIRTAHYETPKLVYDIDTRKTLDI